jgi:hypothetical protein
MAGRLGQAAAYGALAVPERTLRTSGKPIAAHSRWYRERVLMN